MSGRLAGAIGGGILALAGLVWTGLPVQSAPTAVAAAGPKKAAATRYFRRWGPPTVVKGCFNQLSGPVHIIVVEKVPQKLHLYRHHKRTTLVRTYSCATGENPGNKLLEGDRRTPEGVYFFIKVFRDNKVTIFGKQAWHINYPNPVDRLRGRKGNGIYIHGTNKPLLPRSTKGCIALRQQDLDHLSRRIRLYWTPVVVTKRLGAKPRFDDRRLCRRLKAVMGIHGRAFVGLKGTVSAANYTPKHLRRDLRPLDASQAERLAPTKVKAGHFGLIQSGEQAVAWFFQELTLKGGRRVEVVRRLTYLDRPGRVGPLASEWRPADRRLLAALRRHRVRVATRPSPPAQPAPDLSHQHRTIVNLVQYWRQAWQKKDLKTYIACYDESFRAQGMNKAQWKQYKDQLNRRYSFIRVKVSRLRVSLKGTDRAVATFHQSYGSDYFHSRSIKTLRLVKRGGRWRIRRETSRLLARGWRPIERRPATLVRRPPVRLAARPSPPAKRAPAPGPRRQTIADLIQYWSRAWQKKDLKTYIACYDESFRAQGMNKAQWKQYKDRLNRRYSFIRVKVSRLRVSLKGADRAVATFHLSYRSNYFHSRGVKTLELFKRDGRWQIRRETFRRVGG
ncbi:MAG: L,D-transpeptidase family protein [Proteobacteria bacterium]|nr:L,D-transpeptidase family protein [Pseudomonadota bacterium]